MINGKGESVQRSRTMSWYNCIYTEWIQLFAIIMREKDFDKIMLREKNCIV